MSVPYKPTPGSDARFVNRVVAQLRSAELVRLSVSVGEQGIIALTSLATLAVLSRLTSLHELGILVTGLALWMLVEALQRSIVILPFIVTCPRPEANPFVFGSFILLNLIFSSAVALLLMLAGAAILPLNPDFGRATMLAAPLALGGSLFLFVRHTLYLVDRHRLAALNAIAVAASTGLGLLVLSGRSHVSACEGATVITLGYLVPSLLVSIWIARTARYSVHSLLALANHRRLVIELTTASVALHIATNSAQLLLSILSGPASIAVFTLARTLVRPLMLIIDAVVEVRRARLARELDEKGAATLRSEIRATQITLIVLCAPIIVVVLLWPGWLLDLLYGPVGAAATSATRLWAIVLIPTLLSYPMYYALVVFKESRTVARVNLAAMLAMALVVGTAIVMKAFSVSAAILSIGAAQSVFLLLTYWRYRKMRGLLEGAA